MTDIADVIVVGSGAGGATVAKVLAEEGHEVFIVEEGRRVETEEFDANLWRAMKRTFRSLGTQVATGKSMIPMLQGRVVGGTTVINSAITWRTPDDVREDWIKRFGLGDLLKDDKLDRAFDVIEKELGVTPTPEGCLSGSDLIMREACEKAGLAPHKIVRNVVDCEGSGMCLHGCQHGRKQSMALTFIPRAEKNGAVVIDKHRVDSVIVENGRAVGVRGKTMGGINGHVALEPFELRARKAVVISASAIQTPQILLRSGLRSRTIGRHFQPHPGVGMVGYFPQEVRMWDGATQAFEAVPARSERYKLETLGLPPEMLAVRLPGIGRSLMTEVANMKHAACWAVLVRARAEGRVTVPKVSAASGIRYSVLDSDLEIFAKGLKMAADMMFEMGAEYVLPGVVGLPDRLTSPDQTRLITERPLDPKRLTIVSTHLMGTCRIGPNPQTSAIDLGFESHEVNRLYVADSSVFPTNMGVNPQHTIIGLATLASDRIANTI